jgi:dihydrofolate reductase
MGRLQSRRPSGKTGLCQITTRRGISVGKVRVAGFAVSVDGFGAGPEQSLEHPLGRRGGELHGWFYPTQTFRSMFGKEGETEGVDARFARASAEGFGAFILGRNMFGPIRGEWPDESWKGWWGDDPPYHAPTFVLTHHARKAIVMEGGTTYHFVTEGIEAALVQAKAAAGDRDVKIGGGVSTVRQYLLARAIDELHLVVSPIVLGGGESLFEGIDLPGLGYRVAEAVPSERATHVVLTR